jgi:S4 domain protein YaaA
MKNIGISTEYIKLDQFLKLAGIIGSGGEARDFIAQKKIIVNGELESRRGKKLRDGDIISIESFTYKISRNGEEK